MLNQVIRSLVPVVLSCLALGSSRSAWAYTPDNRPLYDQMAKALENQYLEYAKALMLQYDQQLKSLQDAKVDAVMVELNQLRQEFQNEQKKRNDILDQKRAAIDQRAAVFGSVLNFV